MKHLAMLVENRLFVNLSPVQLEQAASFFTRKADYNRYELFIKEGATDSMLYLIERGSAIIKVGGKEVGGLNVGDIIGEVGFIASGKRTANVFAGQDGVSLTVITPQLFRQFGAKAPEAALIISQNINFLLASKLQRTNQILREMATQIQEYEKQRSRDEKQGQSVFKRIFGSFGT